MNPASNNSEVL